MQDFAIGGLCCEGLKNPEGIDVRRPRLSWQMQSEIRGARQAAYRVIVGESRSSIEKRQATLWDSGRIESGASLNVVCDGKPLNSGQKYYWAVCVWGADGISHNWSDIACWSMGLLNRKDWQAEWIGYEKGVSAASSDPERVLPARYLRREFESAGDVTRATAYICGLGYYELYLNGRKTGDHVLDPVLMQYDKHVPYVTYDVTEYIEDGMNTAGVVLGNGRYFAPRGKDFSFKTADFGSPRLLFQLNIEYSNGDTQVVCSDKFWKATDNGPIRENNDYDGEVYDARMELGNWASPDYDSKKWRRAQPVTAPKGKLLAQMMEPHRVISRLKAVAITNPHPGVWVYDFGQNLVGWCRLKISGATGQKIQLRFAEVLSDEGMVCMLNMRTAKSRDVYILSGQGVEEYRPRFSYHGFRYAEITGFDDQPSVDTLVAEVVHSAVEYAGDFECDNPIVNKLIRNMRWGIQGNYRSVPVDCPQRDERQGWLGDRVVVSRGESFLFNVQSLYRKWFDDIRDTQKTDGRLPHSAPAYWPMYEPNITWPSAYAAGINSMYHQYADAGNIRKHYPALKKWLDYHGRLLKDNISSADCYADWLLPPEAPDIVYSKDPERKTDSSFLATAYYFYNLQLMAGFAQLLGKNTDEQDFRQRAEAVKVAFNERFFNENNGQYVNGTQTSALVALATGLTEPAWRRGLLGKLVTSILDKYAGHSCTGVIGRQWLMLTLSENSYDELAWQLATQTTYPGWGYMVEQGATTLWEFWNGNTADPVLSSRNHIMNIGDFLTWAFTRLGGIMSDPDNPGFKNVIMQPHFKGGPRFVKCEHLSPYGKIVSHWQSNGHSYCWQIELPANTTATARIPVAQVADILDNGQPVSSEIAVSAIDGSVIMSLPSGKYNFSWDGKEKKDGC